MACAHRVALQGFSGFERSALASYFRLAHLRNPAYVKVDELTDCEFVIADADHLGALAAVIAADRVRDTLFVGSSAPPGATAWMMRPIDPVHVLRELDAMVALRASERLPAYLPAALPPLRAGGGRHGLDLPLRRASDRDRLDTAVPERRGVDALVVADGNEAVLPVQRELERLGLRIERVHTSDQALERLSGKPYDLVVLDRELGPASELDGMMLCQLIKRQHRAVLGARKPAVMMLADNPSEVDRVRGMLAGCDVYLPTAADERQLSEALEPLGLGASTCRTCAWL